MRRLEDREEGFGFVQGDHAAASIVEQLLAAAEAYHDAQSENNQLKSKLSEIDSSDFIERTARRDYGYCWYGEIIYQVGNLDEIEQQLDFDVYGQD